MSQVDLFSLRPLLSFESLLSAKNKELFNIDNVDDFDILSWTAGGRFDGREFVVIACKSKATSSETHSECISEQLAPVHTAALRESREHQFARLPRHTKSVGAVFYNKESPLSPSHTFSQLQSHSQSQLNDINDAAKDKRIHSDSSSQQYLIIRSVNALPQKLRSKYRRRSKRKHAKLVKDSNIQHLYGDTYHIELSDDDSDHDNKDHSKKHTKTQKHNEMDPESEDDEEESDGIHSVSSIDSEPPDIQNFGGKNFGQRDPNVNYSEYDEVPVLRIITWFKEQSLSPDKRIISMDFNPSGSWLMVTCCDCSVYLLPLRNLLEIPTHQLELSVTTAYELNHYAHNKTEDEFFEQQFGFVNTSNDIKRGGMIRRKRDNGKRGGDLQNIASTSLAHLVLHRGKTNKTKSKKGLFGSGWFASAKKYRLNPWIRNGHDTSEELDDEVCADGHESFGALHDLTVLSHGIPRTVPPSVHRKKKKKKKSNIARERLICANCSVWWKTRSRKDYVIFGTNDGRICLINVRSHKKTWIEIGDETLHICDLELIIDIKSTSMLIHCSKSVYYILLLERPFKKDRACGSLTSALSAQMSQELLMAGYLLNANAQNEDPSAITAWDTIVDHYTLNAFHPFQLNIGGEGEISLSVYHNTGSVIADPHQQTPTPSEKAARMLGLPYPRRRIVASSKSVGATANHHMKMETGLSSISSTHHPGRDTYDPLRTEHAQSCVHFGVFYHQQSKLALHALDEIYQPPRAGFKVQSSLKNVFAHNFIISLAPNQQYNQISIIAPPLASLMSGMHHDEVDTEEDEDEEEIILSSSSRSRSNATHDMLTDTDNDGDDEEEEDDDRLRNMNLKRALAAGKRGNKTICGVIQTLLLDADEKVEAILDRTTSVIMSSPKIYIERLDPLALSQLNKDGTDTFDVTITPTMGKSEIPYGATHSVWSALKSPFLLLLTNKGVYQIDKQFDGFSTVLEYVETQEIEDLEYQQQSKKVVHGLAACCEVNSKSIYEIAADRMLAHNSNKVRDAQRSFELYCGSSVTVAKLIRQFLRPEWLHDAKHDVIVHKIFGILKRLLTTADIPSRITFSDIMFNLLFLQYLIHDPLHSQTQLTRKKLIHFIGLNRECSLKMVIRKLLNISEQELALHVLKSHDDPNAIRSDPVGILTDYFLSITSTLGIQLEAKTAAFIIHNYPLLFLERKLDLDSMPSECWTEIITHMLDKVVKLCGNTSFAQKYHQTQQLYRRRKQQQTYLDSFNHDSEHEEEEEEREDMKAEEEAVRIAMHNAKAPKSYQEETRMRQKQVVQYLADNMKWLSLEQLVRIHSYLIHLKSDILEKLAQSHDNESDDIDALSWSTPGWLLLHLKVLLRIRYVNRVQYNGWDEFGSDEYYSEFEAFIDEVLSKFTGMLDITLILDEMLRYNDLPMAMLLHNKLSNVHDYVITYIRFLLQHNHDGDLLLSTDKRYRDTVLNRIIEKLLMFKCNRNRNNLSLSHAQGRCLAHLIALWMRLKLPLIEIEDLCLKHFEALKYGLTDVLFNHWTNHQTLFHTQTMPDFTPKLMLKITQFALL